MLPVWSLLWEIMESFRLGKATKIMESNVPPALPRPPLPPVPSARCGCLFSRQAERNAAPQIRHSGSGAWLLVQSFSFSSRLNPMDFHGAREHFVPRRKVGAGRKSSGGAGEPGKRRVDGAECRDKLRAWLTWW